MLVKRCHCDFELLSHVMEIFNFFAVSVSFFGEKIPIKPQKRQGNIIAPQPKAVEKLFLAVVGMDGLFALSGSVGMFGVADCAAVIGFGCLLEKSFKVFTIELVIFPNSNGNFTVLIGALGSEDASAGLVSFSGWLSGFCCCSFTNSLIGFHGPLSTETKSVDLIFWVDAMCRNWSAEKGP